MRIPHPRRQTPLSRGALFQAFCPECTRLLDVEDMRWPAHERTVQVQDVLVEGWFPTVTYKDKREACPRGGQAWEEGKGAGP